MEIEAVEREGGKIEALGRMQKYHFFSTFNLPLYRHSLSTLIDHRILVALLNSQMQVEGCRFLILYIYIYTKERR